MGIYKRKRAGNESYIARERRRISGRRFSPPGGEKQIRLRTLARSHKSTSLNLEALLIEIFPKNGDLLSHSFRSIRIVVKAMLKIMMIMITMMMMMLTMF